MTTTSTAAWRSWPSKGWAGGGRGAAPPEGAAPQSRACACKPVSSVMSHLPPPLEASPACPAVTWEWPSQGQRSRAAGLGGFSGGLGSCVAEGAGASRAGAPTAEAGCGLGLSRA